MGPADRIQAGDHLAQTIGRLVAESGARGRRNRRNQAPEPQPAPVTVPITAPAPAPQQHYSVPGLGELTAVLSRMRIGAPDFQGKTYSGSILDLPDLMPEDIPVPADDPTLINLFRAIVNKIGTPYRRPFPEMERVPSHGMDA